MEKVKYKNGEPCNHRGCLNHISHPCEGCGRIGGNDVAYEAEFEFIGCLDIDNTGEKHVYRID